MGKGKAPPPAPDGSPPAYDTGSKPRKSVKFTEDVVEKEHSTIRKTVYQPAPPDEVPKSAIKVGLPSGQGPGGGPRPSQT
ncbi:Oidioi.mRNA.OKI2018_I69.PAR.g9677.t1.cds [Oikopleura dioica]|uniref:Oidioi.mRNA.OKI2018_I69.PAR.g9677.t1.cds n=1 Tax=Oikopleura dioica TaxID=34765 RepID=A0ABN7RLS8_OIKDI|nr:Oidioi.mRNA.OKI2018_I69.PAR.g9677.t1.cds [Oikopleura dioica]